MGKRWDIVFQTRAGGMKTHQLLQLASEKQRSDEDRVVLTMPQSHVSALAEDS
jgi:hypothetical protein